jgi:hypothetical protein
MPRNVGGRQGANRAAAERANRTSERLSRERATRRPSLPEKPEQRDVQLLAEFLAWVTPEREENARGLALAFLLIKGPRS